MSRPDDPTAVAERNIGKLLRRAYRPRLPRPAFRQELKTRVLSGFVTPPLSLPSPRLPSPRLNEAGGQRLPWVRVGLAAAVLVAITAAAFRLGRDAEQELRPEQILARGEVAIRAGAAAPWRAAGADHSILTTDALLEVRTPDATGHQVFAMPFGSLTLAPHTRVELAAAERLSEQPVRLKAWLQDGGLSVERNQGDGRWIFDTDAGAVSVTHGAFELVASARGASDTSASRSVRIRVESGEPWSRWQEERFVLAAGFEWLLVAGSAPERLGPIEPLVARQSDDPDRQIAEPQAGDSIGSPAEDDPASPEPISVSGRVTDALSAGPVTAFELTVLQTEIGEDGEPAYGALPDVRRLSSDQGRFEITGLSPGRYHLFARADSYSTWRSPAFRVLADGRGPVLQAALQRGVSLSGQVVDDRTGAPLAGVLVLSESDTPLLMVPIQSAWMEEMTGGTPIRGATTDALGRFELTGLSPGSQLLRASRDGHVPSWLNVDRLAPGERHFDLEIRLAAGGGVEGMVTHPDGTPRAGAIVLAIPQERASSGIARPVGFGVSEQDGRYRIPDLPAGMVIVVLLGDEPSQPGANTAEQVVPTQVKSTGFTSVDFPGTTLGGTRLFGQLRDADGAPLTRKPLSIALLDAEGNTADSHWLNTNTDDTGAYEFFELAPASYELFATSGDGIQILSMGRLTVPAGVEHRRDFQLSGSLLSGVVQDAASGLPLPRTIVVLKRREPSARAEQFAGKVSTDENGRYSFSGMRPGIYSIQAHFDLQRYAIGQIDGIQIVGEETLDHLDILMVPGGRIDLTLTGKDGQPLADVPVALVHVDGSTWQGAWRPTTGQDGTLSLAGIPAGMWQLHIDQPGSPRIIHPITVEPHGRHPVELELPAH